MPSASFEGLDSGYTEKIRNFYHLRLEYIKVFNIFPN